MTLIITNTSKQVKNKLKVNNTCGCNITNEDIIRIDEQAKRQNHLSNIDNLLDIIKSDEEKLAKYNITFEQLDAFFDKLKSHYHYQKNYRECSIIEVSEFLTKQPREEIHKLILQNEKYFNEYYPAANLLGSNISATYIEWMGAEQCPFQSPDDKKYYGYEYGSRDWIFMNHITNKSLFIGDLLFHEIGKHHFFQSPSSDYHIDVDELVNFFELDTKLDSYLNFDIKEKYTHSFIDGTKSYKYNDNGEIVIVQDEIQKMIENIKMRENIIKLMSGSYGLAYS